MNQSQLQEQPDRDLDYTIVTSKDGSIVTQKASVSGVPIIIFNNDMILFDLCIDKADKQFIYDLSDKLDHVIFYGVGGYQYNYRNRRNIRSLYHMIDSGAVLAKPVYIGMNMTPSQISRAPQKPDVTFNKSGFAYRNDNQLAVYNLIEYVNGLAYVITVVTKDYVTKELTTAVRKKFLEHASKVNEKAINFPEEFHFFEPVGKTSLALALSICDDSYGVNITSLRTALANDPDYIKAVDRLTSPNVVVNIHVLDKNLI